MHKIGTLDDERYTFTVKDFELMVKQNVRIKEVCSDSLRVNGDSLNLVYFVPVLKRLKYLGEFTFRTNPELFAKPPPYHLLTDLPIKSILSSDFEMGRDTIDHVIKTLDQIESLDEVLIWSPIWNRYLLSPDDLLSLRINHLVILIPKL